LAIAFVSIPAEAADAPGKREFEEARALFDAGKPREALPFFELAYELSGKRPSAILALALCERALEMHGWALAHLREYLSAQPSERPKYEAIEAELVQKVEASRPPPPPEPPPPPPEPPPAVEVPPPPPIVPPPPPPPPSIVAPPVDESSGPSALKIGLIGSGAAVVVVGIVFAILAAKVEAEVKSSIAGERPATKAELEDQAATGFGYAVTADVLVSAGAVTAGIALFID
jgi:hypothetical protein